MGNTRYITEKLNKASGTHSSNEKQITINLKNGHVTIEPAEGAVGLSQELDSEQANHLSQLLQKYHAKLFQ